MTERTVLVSGASGLIGSALIDRLRRSSFDVRRLVRREPRREGEYRWDPYDDYIDDVTLKDLDAVVHLSGAGIGDKRWTRERKRLLYDSRIITTRLLADRLAAIEPRPPVFISQSAIGIYGDRGDEILNEDSQPGTRDHFLTQLTRDWELAARPAAAAGIRVVHPRTGLVIAPEADLMRRLLPLFRAGVGGPLGNGRQWWSWITLDDAVTAIAHLIDSDLSGPVNLVAPNPVRQREFARALGRALRRPAVIPVPKPALRLALGGEKAEAIGFASARVSPERLLTSGFEFGDDDLGAALTRMFG